MNFKTKKKEREEKLTLIASKRIKKVDIYIYNLIDTYTFLFLRLIHQAIQNLPTINKWIDIIGKFIISITV